MQKNFIICYTIIVQVITAMFLLFFSEPVRVASLGVFYQIFSAPQLGALIMLLSVVSAVVGLSIPTKNKLHFLFFLPQYIFLLLTAGSSLNYVLQGMYADGVVRPWQFIFVDQLYVLVLAVLYTPSIFNFGKEKNGTTEIGEINTKK